MAHSKVSEAPLGKLRLISTTGLALGLLLALGGCSRGDWLNPVQWYRDAAGISSGDTTGEERNTANLDQGGKEPYPNLATVPSPPTNALSAEERDKLRNSLAADRANAKYLENGDQLVPTPPSTAPSPTSPQRPTAQPTPPPTPPSTPEAPSSPTPSASGPPQSAPAQAPSPSPPTQSVSAPPQSAPAQAPSPTPPTQSASGPPPGKAGPSGTPIPQGSNAQRAPVRGSEAPPQESPLTPPTVRSVPQGEAPRPAPPPPPGVRPQSPAAPTPAQAPTPAPGQPPQQTASLPPQPSAPASAPSAGGSEVTVTVGSIVLEGGNKLSPGDREQLASIARLRQQNGGIVHVTGYSALGTGRDAVSQQMSGFGAALERAKAVAQALMQAGVPAQFVAVGAVPAPPGQSANTVELTLEY